MCFHDRMGQFTFSEDAGSRTIKMCPDCDAFDKQRIAILKTGHVDTPDMETQIRWDIVLNKAGLGMDEGRATEGLVSCEGNLWDLSIVALQQMQNRPLRVVATPLDDLLWQERQTPFQHTRTMPRLLTNFCVTCKAYLPVNHLCEIK